MRRRLKKQPRRKSTKRAVAEFLREKRRAEVAKLRLAGLSVREIAAKLDVASGTVQNDLTELFTRTAEAADDAIRMARALQAARLDVALGAIWRRIEKGDLEAIDRFIRLEQRRARLEGIDAADRLELSGPQGAPITIDARTALLERLSGAIARAAAEGAAPEPDPQPDG